MILHGSNLIVKAGGTAIAAAKSCVVDVQAEEIEVSSPLTGTWRTYIAGRKSWNINVSGLVQAQNVALPDHLRNILEWGGQTLSLSVELSGAQLIQGALPFDGFISGETIENTGATSAPNAIFWDTDRFIFVGRVGLRYYRTWTGGSAYSSPETDSYFYHTSEGEYYRYNSADLYPVDQQVASGQALCKSVRATGSVGSLATYQMQFVGSGELEFGE